MGALDDLIRRARRRHLQNLLLKHAARAVSTALAGLIFLLLVGTQVLDWRWTAALAALSLAAGFRTLPRKIPSRYGIAQQIDRRLGLYDSLSTALFYNRLNPDRPAQESMRAAQLSEAERLARSVDVACAVPFAFSRSLYAMTVLVLVASSLLALRYGISRTLDLRPPLATLVFDNFPFFSEPEAVAKQKREVRHSDDRLKQFGLPVSEDSETNAGAEQSTQGLSTESSDSEAAGKESAADSSRERASASVGATNRRKQGTARGEGEREGSTQSSGDDRDSPSPAASKGESSGRSPASRQAAASQHENNGLLDKFRDAMANLLSRLRSQRAAGDSRQTASDQQSDSSRSQREQGRKDGGQAARRGAGSPNGDPEAGEQGEGAEQARSSSGKQGGKEAGQASDRGQSGIGKDDGSKDIREAEQLAAMGKISEIIGKRSQNLTGEVMVEVASGKQELRTAYSRQQASHTDSGGEIHRDEIPLAYQRYVQRYFDEVRKTPPAGKPGTDTPKAKSAAQERK